MSKRGWVGLVRGWMTVTVLGIGLLGSATVVNARANEHGAHRTVTLGAAPERLATKTRSSDAAAPDGGEGVAAASEGSAKDTGAAEENPSPSVSQLRRLRGDELNAALVAQASEIIRRHHREPFGTEVPFSIEGREYVGRIERHYHPEGGALKPWGFHPGCSLFAVVAAL